jgi:flagellar hook-associated protein 2
MTAIDLSQYGLGAGLNDTTLINGLVQAESVPLTQLQQKQANIQDASQTVTAFSSDLSALQTAAKALSDASGFSSYAAASSSPAITATATGGASPGTTSVTVNALASEQRTYSDPQTSATDPLGMTGTLSLTVGTGTPLNINVTSGESLTDIATAISSSGARVSANIVFDGSQYRLQVAGLDTGASNAVTFGESGFSLGLSTPANTVQKAQDASVTVDGYTLTRPTNQLVGVIPGVTLALTQTTTTPATLTVSSDPTSIENKLQTFVAAYNKVISDGHTDTGYGTSAASNTLLAGDSNIRSTMDRLSSILAAPVANASGKYSSVGSAGLTLNADGTISLDGAALSNALQTDPTSVQRLFVTDASTGATGIMSSISSLVDTMATGVAAPLQQSITSYAESTSELSKEITDEQARVTAYQTQLQTQFTAMDSLVNAYKAQMNAINSLTNSNNSSGSSSSSSSGGTVI